MLRSSPRPRPAPAVSILKHLIAIVVILVVAGCSGGGGCGGGCAGCGGITPLPNGFDAQHRIENAGSVRLTQSGLGFLQSNIGVLAKGLLGGMSTGGVITFPVPMSSGTGYTVCPNGPDPNANPKICTAEIDIGNAALTITPTAPYDLHITGTVPLRVSDLQLNALGCGVDIAINSDGSCPGGDFDPFPLAVDIAIHVDQDAAHVARFGYTRVEIPQVLDDTAAKGNLSSNLHICGSGFFCGTLLGNILNLVKGPIVNALYPQIKSTLTTQIDGALCQKATAMMACPSGTTADGSMICRYADNTCASTILGTEGHMDLGRLLASVSPGTRGGLDFLFAAGGPDKNSADPGMMLSWGDLDPINNGATLGMFGGAEPSPLSKCVKLSTVSIPTGIPIPSELFGNAVPADWPAAVPGPHLGLAISERFANYAFNGVYNSGLLCIGISTEGIPLLASGTLGLLAPSAKDLGLQHDPQQVAIVIRPSAPPTLTFGNGTDLVTDPLIDIKLNQASLDFYFYSLDRFIRFMTATFDLDVPVNLSVGPDGLTPVINKIGVTNGKVTNNKLLREAPEMLAASLGDLIGSLVGQQLGGSLKPIDLNKSLASLGLKLIIPDSVPGKGSPGLRKLSQASDNYLGIFAAFALPNMGPVPPPLPGHASGHASHSRLELTRKTVDRAGLKLATLTRDNVPVVELHLGSELDDGTRAVEFAYKIDDGFWHPWTPARDLVVRDDWLRVQGRHLIQVRSRAVGDSDSVDAEPATLEMVIDAEPPTVSVQEAADGKITVTATDLLTPDAELRYRLDGGGWSRWTPASQLGAVDVGHAGEIIVEARDSEGNVGTATQPLVRGRADGVTGAGCGCAVVGALEDTSGTGSTPSGLWLLGIALAGVGARLRAAAARKAPSARSAPKARTALSAGTRRALGGLAAAAFASSWAGCSCGNTQTAAHSTGHATSSSSGSSGGYACTGSCVPLQPGLIGAYTSAAVSGGTLWFAGYSEADWDNSISYGDLVAGKWDGTKVIWDQVDGVPDMPKPDGTVYDLHGFRGGQAEPGDDVGLWTSIAVGGDGNPAIAYYDRTHKALKFAQYDGKRWAVQQVEAKDLADIGRYAKMLFLNGNFVIAYQSIEAGGTNGAVVSKVRIASSAGATPAAGGWVFEDAAVSLTSPCRAAFCAAGSACVASTKVCTPTLAAGMCGAGCSSSQACVTGMAGPACAAIYDGSKLDAYPDAIGGYISIAPDGQGGFGVAYYDRTNGLLDIAAKVGGKWTTTIVDGQDPMGHNIADVGIGTSLFIDPVGDWHLTYVNGFTEAVQYVKVTKGTAVGAPEIVDDGLGLGGTPFDDGQHLVGDDSHVVVLSSGEIHVTYQDATAGTLHHAVGTAGASGHTWTVSSPTQDGFAGAFSTIVVTNNQLQLASWWRVGGMSVKGDVRVVAP